ncbi:hypothetical protein Tco_1480484 [Tanacetum coccineum]
MEGNDDGQDSDKNKLRFKDDSVRKRLSFAEVAVRYAVEPQPLPSAKPHIMPLAQTKPMSLSQSNAMPQAVPDAKISKYQMHSLGQK